LSYEEDEVRRAAESNRNA